MVAFGLLLLMLKISTVSEILAMLNFVGQFQFQHNLSSILDFLAAILYFVGHFGL